MNILITGATGFIGSHLVRRLLQEKHNLFCTLIDKEKNPYGEEYVKSMTLNSSNIIESINFVSANKIEGIIHLASYVISGDHEPKNIAVLIDSNVKFGVLLLEIAVQSNVKWMINTGTYWQNYNQKEYSPVNLYASTKQAFEDIAKFYYEIYDILFCTIRLYDTYGKNDTRNKIFNLWNTIAKTGEVIDMSPGEQIMDFSYIDDIVDAYLLLIYYFQNNPEKVMKGDVFYLQSPERYSLKELSIIFEDVSGRTLNINWGGKKYKKREIMIPLSNKRTIPGFKHKVSIREGIRRLLDEA